MAKKKSGRVETLFEVNERLTDAAYAYGQDSSNENAKALREAAREYAAIAEELEK